MPDRQQATIRVADHDWRRKSAFAKPRGGVTIVRDGLPGRLERAALNRAAVQGRHYVVAAPVEGERREAELRQMRGQKARHARIQALDCGVASARR
jgi:hypothetical protein